MEPEKLIKCDNCHLDIDESKFQMHQGFCLRYNKYCSICSSAVLLSEFDEHEQNHMKQQQQQEEEAKEKEKKAPIQPNIIDPITNKNEIKKETTKYKPRPIIKPREIIPPKFDLCEYCASYYENINEHFPQCQMKILLEKEKQIYNQENKQRTQNDIKIAQQMFKEEEKKRPNDAELAKKLQMEFDKQNPKQKLKDIDLAKRLQDEYDQQNPRPNDAELAHKLQLQFENEYNSQMSKLVHSNDRFSYPIHQDQPYDKNAYAKPKQQQIPKKTNTTTITTKKDIKKNQYDNKPKRK